MPISTPTLKNEILAMLNNTADLQLEQAKDKFAEDLANAVVRAIKSSTITISSGLIVTVGGPTTQSNPAPIIIQNGIF